MKKFAVDYSSLQNSLEKPKVYKLADVQDKIRKVAFDVVRFLDSDNIDGLWQIQHTSDGDYIVAMYGEETGKDAPVTKSSSVKTDWSVVADKSGSNLNFFYKDTHVTRLSTSALGLPNTEASFVTSYLPAKLASNTKLVSGLLQELSPEERKELLTKHPELNK